MSGAAARGVEVSVFNTLVDVLEASPSGWATPAADRGKQRDLEVQAKLRDLAEGYRSGFVLPLEWAIANEHLRADRILGCAYDLPRFDFDMGGHPQVEGASRLARVRQGHLLLMHHLLPGGATQPPPRPQGGRAVREDKPSVFVQLDPPTIILVDPLGVAASWAMKMRSQLEQRAAVLAQRTPSCRIHIQILQAGERMMYPCKEQSFSMGDVAEVMPGLPYHALAGLVEAMEDTEEVNQHLHAAQLQDSATGMMQRSRLVFQHQVEPDDLLGVVWIRWLPNDPALAAVNKLDADSPNSFMESEGRMVPLLPKRDRRPGVQFDTALWAEAVMEGCNHCIPGELPGPSGVKLAIKYDNFLCLTCYSWRLIAGDRAMYFLICCRLA